MSSTSHPNTPHRNAWCRLVRLLEPVRRGWDLHLTTIRNEQARSRAAWHPTLQSLGMESRGVVRQRAWNRIAFPARAQTRQNRPGWPAAGVLLLCRPTPGVVPAFCDGARRHRLRRRRSKHGGGGGGGQHAPPAVVCRRRLALHDGSLARDPMVGPPAQAAF
jgi:hypothetical protein